MSALKHVKIVCVLRMLSRDKTDVHCTIHKHIKLHRCITYIVFIMNLGPLETARISDNFVSRMSSLGVFFFSMEQSRPKSLPPKNRSTK